MSTPIPTRSETVAGEARQPGGGGPASRKTVLIICVLLVAAVAAVYWPVGRYQFIHCDDPDYVSRNSHVQAGLTWAGVVWAFTATHAGNWHPVTWLSHMLDCQLFGVNPGAHHLVNAVFHAANTVLLFLLLRRLTGATWRSALVAALFGVHPLHVESVAWISERKDVLSTLFFLLTLGAYVRSSKSRVPSPESRVPGPEFKVQSSKFKVQSSGAGVQGSEFEGRGARGQGGDYFWYTIALVCYALGLMSKPMLVTTPFVLLLLDYWPLGRIQIKNQKSRIKNLLLEKLPFFGLSAASCAVTFIAQGHAHAVIPISLVPIGVRIENALVAYLEYLEKAVAPVKLTIFYPYPDAVPGELVALALVVLLGFSWAAWWLRVRRPYLIVGWLWFLGTLVPVIGLVQVGSQSMADRYSYIPLIGIFVVVVWAAEEAVRASRRWQLAAIGGAAALVVASVAVAAVQVRFWKNSQVLFRHALAVTERNALAHLNLGTALADEGKLDEAGEHYREALRICSFYTEAQSNLGFILATQGKWSEAIPLYRAALAAKPEICQTHFLLGSALVAQGEVAEAIPEYEAALQLEPNHEIALNDLAWLRATAADARLRDGAQAVTLAERVCRRTQFKVPQYIGTLAAAYAEAGRFEEAVTTAERARKLAVDTGDHELAARNEDLLRLYGERKAYHETPR